MFCTDPPYTRYYVKPNIPVLKRAWHLQPSHLNIKQHDQKRQGFYELNANNDSNKSPKGPQKDGWTDFSVFEGF